MRYFVWSVYVILLCNLVSCIEEEPAASNSANGTMFESGFNDDSANGTMFDSGFNDDSANDTMAQPVASDMTGNKMMNKCGMKMMHKCGMKEEMSKMSALIKVLMEEVQSLKEQIDNRCSTLGIGEFNSHSAMEITDDSEDLFKEAEMENQIELQLKPKPMMKCAEPFKKINEICFSIFNDPSDWKSWGDASAHCQGLDSRLASPENPKDLQNYLKNNYSNVFWVGARKTENDPNFEWMNGRKVTDEEWKDEQPTKTAAKFCVFLESFSGYRAVNHYCGAKFPFICQA